jgi:hypothetical protein
MLSTIEAIRKRYTESGGEDAFFDLLEVAKGMCSSRDDFKAVHKIENDFRDSRDSDDESFFALVALAKKLAE